MPFPISWLEEKIATSAREDRLAHAYLLTGGTSEELESAFYRLAATLLASPDPQHPDLHTVHPASKSRRITIDQIRALESQLHLKSLRQGRKIAGIFSAERMCLPPANAANAFLKTLEEPPENTLIFLISDRPEQFLPTIKSRCLTLELQSHHTPPPLLPQDWLEAWFQPQSDPVAGAYFRSRLLNDLFATFQKQVEDENPKPKSTEEDEQEAWKALVQSRLIALRERALAELTCASWTQAQASGQRLQASSVCLTLDDLRVSLSRNVDAALAIDRCCLKLAGLI
jgi:DNA polymerase-3 subunit delta'